MAELDLGPAELDRLEDALEDLELDGALERWLENEPSPGVRERLADYRSLLEASRQALPIEEVPAGLLDGVIAEARQAATVAPAAAAAASASWWTRLRRSFMVPALALAGTAALVLWIGRPDQQAELAEPPAGSARPARTVTLSFDEEPSDNEEPAQARSKVADPAPAAAPGVEGGEADKLGEAAKSDEPELVQPAQTPALDPLGDAPDEKKDAKPEPDPSDAEPDRGLGSASGRWDIVSLGDRARQAGDCVAAREEYALALEDDEARVRARALAGIGLCDRQNGDMPSADANFERARELDGDIDSFIDSQTRAKRKRTSSPKKAKKSKPSAAVTDPFG